MLQEGRTEKVWTDLLEFFCEHLPQKMCVFSERAGTSAYHLDCEALILLTQILKTTSSLKGL